MVCISTVCGSILDDYFSAREIIAICQVLCTMSTFVSHFRGLMVSFMRLFKFALFQPWKHSFLTQEFMLRFRNSASRRQFAEPLHLQRFKKVFIPLCRSMWIKKNYVQISLRISDPVSELHRICEVIAFVLRVGTLPAACRTKTLKIPGSSLFGLTSTGGNRCRSINNIRKRISNCKQRFSRKSDPSTEYDIIGDDG